MTQQHEHVVDHRHKLSKPGKNDYALKPLNGLHLIVLPTGKNANNPICITMPKPSADSSYDVRVEVETLLNNNKSDLTFTYANNDLYWKMRKKQNEKMSVSILLSISSGHENTYVNNLTSCRQQSKN